MKSANVATNLPQVLRFSAYTSGLKICFFREYGFESRPGYHFRYAVHAKSKYQLGKPVFPLILFLFALIIFVFTKMGLLTIRGLPSLCSGTLRAFALASSPVPGTIFVMQSLQKASISLENQFSR